MLECSMQRNAFCHISSLLPGRVRVSDTADTHIEPSCLDPWPCFEPVVLRILELAGTSMRLRVPRREVKAISVASSGQDNDIVNIRACHRRLRGSPEATSSCAFTTRNILGCELLQPSCLRCRKTGTERRDTWSAAHPRHCDLLTSHLLLKQIHPIKMHQSMFISLHQTIYST